MSNDITILLQNYEYIRFIIIAYHIRFQETVKKIK